MRIAVFSEMPTFNPALPNGISSFIEATSRRLAKLGHEIHIFEPNLYCGQKSIIKVQENIIKHHVFSFGVGPYQGFRMSLPIGTIFKKLNLKFHIIHAHGPILGIAASALGKKENTVKIVHYHTPGQEYTQYIPRFLPIRYKSIVDIVEKIVYNSFDLMVTPAQKVKRDLIRRGFDENKLFVLPNCIDLEENNKWIDEVRIQTLRERFQLDGKKIVLFVGRMSPEKRIPDILKLIPGIIKEEPDTHFLMVGKGPYLEQYKALGKRIAPYDVTFTGYVSNEDLPNILKMGDVGLIAVDSAQVFDITLLDYWSNQLAVCARQAGGMAEVISHYKNGMLFTKLEEAHNYILTLLQDEKLCKKLGNKGYETLKRKYCVERITDDMLKLYKLAAEKYHIRGRSILTHFLKFLRTKGS
ncbi:MAG: glycosyltransferase [Candidatus Helarchaeota archaeon]